MDSITMINNASVIHGIIEKPNRERTASTASSPGKNKRKSSSLPTETVEYLKAWMMSPEHIAHPYPTEPEKNKIMEATGIELKQLTNWFVNNRKRYWKPRVEARLQEQATAPAATPVNTYIKPKRSHSSNSSVSSYSSSVMAVPSSLTHNAVIDQSIIGTADLMARMTSVSPFSSPRRAVSEHSSVASESGSVTSSSEDDMEEVKTESVVVHILRSVSGQEPSLEDVTVLANIPGERIVRSYPSTTFSYRVSTDAVGDRRKIQSRRDTEIVRMKKQYLKLYLAECSAVAPSTPKRQRIAEPEVQAPRKQYRRISVELWKEACLSTNNGYDQCLPSLEEATQLFGYGS